jgi:polyisoprenoid-binding protein YceI
MKKSLAFFTLLLMPCLCFSTVWKILPEKSSLTFTATQNNAPVSGNFKTFTADIDFDPAKLNTSHATVSVDINSVTASYQELVTTLLGADWFNAKQYPKAIFKSTSIAKVKDNDYQVQGNLSIRDKTIPVTVFFNLKKYTGNSAVFVGHASLKRLLFGVGQGDWAKTDQVKDDVEVNFSLFVVQS